MLVIWIRSIIIVECVALVQNEPTSCTARLPLSQLENRKLECLVPDVIIPPNLKGQTLRSTKGPLAQKAI